MPTAIIQLVDETPRYYTNAEKDRALRHHYLCGGKMWKRKDGVSDRYKQWATGELPESRLFAYELFMVNGRDPNAQTVN